MITDPIADMLTRIRNGYLAKKGEVVVPHSRFKEELAKILKNLNYIEKVETVKDGEVRKIMKVTLKYKNGVPAVSSIDRVSKPGIRIYKNHRQLPTVLSGMGNAIVSTSQGLMTVTEARKKHLGGEVLLRVY